MTAASSSAHVPPVITELRPAAVLSGATDLPGPDSAASMMENSVVSPAAVRSRP